MSFHKKIYIKPLRVFTVGQWLFLWFKEWLIPRVSVAVGVILISRILFAIDPALWIDGVGGVRLNELFDRGTKNVYFSVIIFSAISIITALASRFFKGRLRRHAFYNDQLFPITINVLIFVANSLFVPLIFTLHFAFNYQLINNDLFCVSLGYMTALIAVSTSLHYLKNFEENPERHITYNLDLSSEKKLPYTRVIKETEKFLSDCLGSFPYINNAQIVAHSKDNHITLVVPVPLDFKHWSENNEVLNVKKNDFIAALDKVEGEWKKKSWDFYRFDFIDKKLPEKKFLPFSENNSSKSIHQGKFHVVSNLALVFSFVVISKAFIKLLKRI
jgi:hypothetical protein